MMSNTIKQPAVQILLAILILFLCFGSQINLPVAGVSVTEILEADFDQFDLEEDLLATNIAAASAGLNLHKLEQKSSKIQASCLSPVSPPPKPI
jgi:GMP synthase-like glutamine amidotransferase